MIPKFRFYAKDENNRCLGTDNIDRSEVWIKNKFPVIDTELGKCYNYSDSEITWVLS